MTVCRNNLRQMAIAFQMYVSDFQSYPPDSYNFPSGTKFWFQMLESYSVSRWPGGIYKCPSYEFTSSGSAQSVPGGNGFLLGTGPFGSYGYNSSFGSLLSRWSLTKNGFPLPESAVVSPNDMILAADSQLTEPPLLLGGAVNLFGNPGEAGSSQLAYAAGIPSGDSAAQSRVMSKVMKRHRGKSNTTFCDGHIESNPYAALSKNDPSVRSRWCYDNNPHLEITSAQ